MALAPSDAIGKGLTMSFPFKRFLSGHGGAFAALAVVSAVEAQLYLGFGMRHGASPPPALFETLLSPLAEPVGAALSVCRFLDMFVPALLVNGIVFHLCARVGRARLARRAELDRYAGMRVDPEEIRRRVAEYRLRHAIPGVAPKNSSGAAPGAVPEPPPGAASGAVPEPPRGTAPGEPPDSFRRDASVEAPDSFRRDASVEDRD